MAVTDSTLPGIISAPVPAPTLLNMLMIDPRPGMSMNDSTLPGREYFCLRGTFPDQEKMILENPEISDVFSTRKN
jgi:hypothetical protein